MFLSPQLSDARTTQLAHQPNGQDRACTRFPPATELLCVRFFSPVRLLEHRDKKCVNVCNCLSLLLCATVFVAQSLLTRLALQNGCCAPWVVRHASHHSRMCNHPRNPCHATTTNAHVESKSTEKQKHTVAAHSAGVDQTVAVFRRAESCSKQNCMCRSSMHSMYLT